MKKLNAVFNDESGPGYSPPIIPHPKPTSATETGDKNEETSGSKR